MEREQLLYAGAHGERLDPAAKALGLVFVQRSGDSSLREKGVCLPLERRVVDELLEDGEVA